MGDPWLPVDIKGLESDRKGTVKVLTFPTAGITAEHMRQLVFEDGLRLHALQKPQPTWSGDMSLSVSVLVRGQGTTNGFYEWELRIPERKVVSIFGAQPQRDELKKLSTEAMEFTAVMQNRVLKPAALPTSSEVQKDLTSTTPSPAGLDEAGRDSIAVVDGLLQWLFSVPDSFDRQEELRRWVSI